MLATFIQIRPVTTPECKCYTINFGIFLIYLATKREGVQIQC